MIPALAFCDFDSVVGLPEAKRYINPLRTLNNHIHQLRIELKVSHDDLALLLDVTKQTIVFWETEQMAPDITTLPKIIAFLGYNPLGGETDTLGGKIKQYRYLHGLSQRKLALLLGVSFTTVKSWEENEFMPTEDNFERLMELMEK